MSFSIATFNIWKNEGDFPKRILENSKELQDIDIICLQEDYNDEEFSSSEVINQDLSFYRTSMVTREKKRDGKVSSSNLTILSRFPITNVKEIYFNEGEDEERGAQFVEILIENKKIALCNTHLCHISSENRIEQITKIQEEMNNNRSDISIFLGDLNGTPNSPEIEIIKTCFQRVSTDSTYKDGEIYDYIFYKSLLNLSVKAEVKKTVLSDHYILKNQFSYETTL
ncbi:MAG: endonuclease/exonuclease/phosphatase family protein [Campylobacterales bacterium]|nr:endonuclease/exonuclease/phosphatase family protein [Campylobacterales bacterium]